MTLLLNYHKKVEEVPAVSSLWTWFTICLDLKHKTGLSEYLMITFLTEHYTRLSVLLSSLGSKLPRPNPNQVSITSRTQGDWG